MLELEVLGLAQTAGSKRAFVHPHTKRAIVTDDNPRSKSWKQEVRAAAATCPECHGDGEVAFNPSRIGDPQMSRPVICPTCGGTGNRLNELLSGPLTVEFTFTKPRPAAHYRTGANAHLLRQSAPAWPGTRPDVLKLARAVEDALCGVVYRDDAQIVDEFLFKRFGTPAGCRIRIWRKEALP